MSVEKIIGNKYMLNFCFIPKLFYLILNFTLQIIQGVLFKKIENEDIKKILIYRIGTLGDNITAMPSIYNIIESCPDAKIDLLCSGGGNSVLSMDNLIDNTYFNTIINYDNYSKKDLINKLKNNKYDLVIELPNNLSTLFRNIRNMIFFKLFIGIGSGFGWKVSTIKLFKKLQDKCIKFDNEIDRLQKILKENDINVDETKFILKAIDNEEELYQKYNIEDVKNIAIVVGAKRSQNRWPVEFFQEVVDYILEKGYKVYIVGGKEDLEISQNFISNDNLIDLCGKLTPLENASILKKCKLTITNDTGPMHLSYAVDTPVIAIFSSWQYDGKWYPPYNNKNIVIRNNNINCKLCFTNKCIDNICMKEIKAKEIIDELYRRNV